MLFVCFAMLGLGLGSVAVSGTVVDPETKDRLENLLEWHLGLLLTGGFVLHALLLRRASHWQGVATGLGPETSAQYTP